MADVRLGADEEGGWLTLTEIARRLGHPASTISSRRTHYRDHLEERPGEHGRALYRLDVFRAMDRLMAENAGKAEIGRVLDGLREREVAEAPSFEAAVLERLDRIEAAIRRLVDRLEREDD